MSKTAGQQRFTLAGLIVLILRLALTLCRVALVENYRRELTAAMALHSANAPVTATRLLDWEQPLVTEVMAWALDSPLHLAAHAYVDIVWNCMPLLSPRLDIGQRQAFCEVTNPNQQTCIVVIFDSVLGQGENSE